MEKGTHGTKKRQMKCMITYIEVGGLREFDTDTEYKWGKQRQGVTSLRKMNGRTGKL